MHVRVCDSYIERVVRVPDRFESKLGVHCDAGCCSFDGHAERDEGQRDPAAKTHTIIVK